MVGRETAEEKGRAMKGWIITRKAKDGTKRYDAAWRVGQKIKTRTFTKRRAADTYLTDVVKRVHDGVYVTVKPALVGEIFDRWLELALTVRVKEGSLKPSTAKAYRSMIEEHLRPAFGKYRSDRLTLDAIEGWRAGIAEKIAAATMAPKFYVNLRNLLHVILTWARHPQRRYLSHDPLDGLPKLHLPKTKKRPHFEPVQIAELLTAAAASPPDDTIIRMAVYSGLRRGEIFGLQWVDLDAETGQDGGRLHVRRGIYQGALSTPKTEDSERVVDLPRRLIDDLAVYRMMYPSIGAGFIFRQSKGQPMDPDAWHRDHLVPILKRVGLYQKGTGLHAIRHTYVSLLIASGEDVGYIADQVGHSTTKLTQDIYRHVFSKVRTDAMRRLDAAIPSSIHPAEGEKAQETGENTRE
jgi:integrase